MEVDAMEFIVVAAGVLLLIGFICGYIVRGLISRWRRIKAERRDFERLVEKPGRRG
jgi:NhaP-type Na+/H+ or K+/H+ antiporter